jgi:tRNA-binding EMAP/Myf-like protein
MVHEDNKKFAGGFVEGKFICAHCLTEEDKKDLEKILTPDEMLEAQGFMCTVCGKQSP